ncbi:diguanylate cyclase [Elizabethkingia bruuniana]|uniref:Diguanylate cyclase n=1 Tax=Elizabethkingia bruuniana TaxID=1756149 RepID=A0A7T7UVQ4_9FLAO|nr:diguanylate cyclase [Elizabethkingia bruuniana]KGO09090.1 diguanylate cyclase [Elizabethkingia miricola]AQX83688.1 diguanylate cyclase [Elizabethkingia bruuniana]KUY22197.1 diguanylate cyclase [Elizabethkingia bruuniana]OPB62408.1 diguanylate cyclase [Elizabethkingia bruuniana]QDZ63556.1 diguanylate cyclase [Elizabethkingia bruuniana]
MLKKYWNYIANMHVTKEMNKLEVIQARIINQVIFIKGIFFIIDAVRDMMLGLITNSYILFGLGCMLLSSFFFHKARFNPYVIFTIFLFIGLLVFYYSSKDGFDNGITFYYFSLLAIVLLLLNGKAGVSLIVVYYAIIFILFCISHVFDFHLITSELLVHEDLENSVRIITFIQAFILLALAGYFIVLKHNQLAGLYQQVLRSEFIISELNKKLNEDVKINVNDVVKSAMENDVSFIPLFKKAFPDFYDNLASVNSHITGDEFKFCALLKLGFRTKDIAEYCHFTVRTVQTKKNRLRKSFNIPSETDLYLWIDSF